jgi:hypothetical protein
VYELPLLASVFRAVDGIFHQLASNWQAKSKEPSQLGNLKSDLRSATMVKFYDSISEDIQEWMLK